MPCNGPGVGCVILKSAHAACGECPEQAHGYCQSDAVKVQHAYPLKIIIPQYANQSNCKWIYPVTFGGGLVGGDHINLDIMIGCHCCGLVTSTESLKIYKCDDNTVTRQTARYTVEDHSLLCVIADPVVCFRESNFIQDQVIRMTSQSNVVFLDWTLGGRVSLDELWTFQSYTTKLSIYVDGRLVLKESSQLKDTPFQSVVQSMGVYQVTGFCVVLGTQVKHVTQHLHELYGKPYNIGDKMHTDVICTISPLSYTVNNTQIAGCYVRFLAASTNKAYSLVRQMIEPLTEVLGGEPLNRTG
ncbi:urease accessory protein D-like [Gigantopelta aegis]|uniref:urease accessory protein D-like n=1 Tax=Gigantopelta aegis TaxID=1735272 RepID=UPI001B889E7B|nr:urease accessory protein D-like [Gigantopelta aegis]